MSPRRNVADQIPVEVSRGAIWIYLMKRQQDAYSGVVSLQQESETDTLFGMESFPVVDLGELAADGSALVFVPRKTPKVMCCVG